MLSSQDSTVVQIRWPIHAGWKDCDGLCVGLWVWILDDLWMIIIYYGGKKPDQDHHQLS